MKSTCDPNNLTETDPGLTPVFGVCLGVAIACLAFACRRFQKARELKMRARQAALDQANLIEIKATEQARQIHERHAEKIHAMYRFVEFGRLAGGLFHDLMTPLNTLSLAFLSIKERAGSPPACTCGKLYEIESQLDSCVRASTRIKDFIDIAKRQLQHRNDDMLFEIGAEIKNTVSLLESRARSKGVTILFSKRKSARIFGSPILFSHVMTNLISNAIDSYESMGAGASKIVRVHYKKKRAIEIKVRDFGSGIEPHIQPHIFDSFFTTKLKHGCGIGLSATKRTLEKHFNGSISFVSSLGLGTAFTVKIPLPPRGDYPNT